MWICHNTHSLKSRFTVPLRQNNVFFSTIVLHLIKKNFLFIYEKKVTFPSVPTLFTFQTQNKTVFAPWQIFFSPSLHKYLKLYMCGRDLQFPSDMWKFISMFLLLFFLIFLEVILIILSYFMLIFSSKCWMTKFHNAVFFFK